MNLKGLSSLIVIGTLASSIQIYAKGDKRPSLEVKDEVSVFDSANQKEKEVKEPKVFSDEEIEKKLQELTPTAVSERIKNIEELKKIHQSNIEKIYANKIATEQEIIKLYQDSKPTNAVQRRDVFQTIMKKRMESRELERNLNESLRETREKFLGDGEGRKWKMFKENFKEKKNKRKD